MTKKGFIILIWFVILLLGPITIYLNSDLNAILNSPILITNLFQRLTGMLAFLLLFIQILLGSFMNYWQRYLGAKTFKYHVFEGLFTYGVLLIHPLLYVVFTYQALNKVILFLIPRLDINPLNYEIYLTYGRIAFVLLSIGVGAGLLRNKPFMRVHWRKFHILNYFAFFFVSFHALNVGSDINSSPFNWFFWIAQIVISIVVISRFIYPRLKPFLSKQAQTPQP